jgi:hypothetical protein
MSVIARAIVATAILCGAACAADAGDPDPLALRRAAARATAAPVVAVAPHPAFVANARVYVLSTERIIENEVDVFAPPMLVQRVDRFVWNGADLVFEQPVLRFQALDRDAHGAGVAPLRFAADGTLHVVIGAAALGWRQNLVAPAPGEATGDDVVVRLADDGSIPADNPFAGVAAILGGDAGGLDAIFAVRPR